MINIIAIILSFFMAFNPMVENSEKPIDHSLHSRTAIIYEINDSEDIVYLIDSVGYVWAFEGVEDWIVGDIVSFTLWDKNNMSFLILTVAFMNRGECAANIKTVLPLPWEAMMKKIVCNG